MSLWLKKYFINNKQTKIEKDYLYLEIKSNRKTLECQFCENMYSKIYKCQRCNYTLCSNCKFINFCCYKK